MDELPNVNSNYRNRKTKPDTSTPRGRYEDAVNAFKSLLADKTHPDVRTESYKKNVISVLNRLCVAADELDSDPENQNSAQGIFGLIVTSLTTALSLKDKIIEQEVIIQQLESRIKKLEKR